VNRLEKIGFEETHDGRRLRIVLDGGKGNVIDTRMASELADVLREQVDGRHLKAVTLEASGAHFSFGASVKEHSPDLAPLLIERLHAVVVHLVELDLPVLAAVRGRCLGGGLEVVLPCQRIVAAPDAHLGQPEIKLGMYAPAGSVLLPERVGRGVAEEMLLTGRVLNAEEALAAGLVNAVSDDPEAAVVEWFEQNLLPLSATALRFATRAARESLRPRVHAALSQVEHLFLEELLETDDAKEGIASFAEKRAPSWVDA
jgi:cyclohexa-1,5-dienecarbonyl-CoA hydratase